MVLSLGWLFNWFPFAGLTAVVGSLTSVIFMLLTTGLLVAAGLVAKSVLNVRTVDDTYATFLVGGDGKFAPKVVTSTDVVFTAAVAGKNG